ncbi:hypothetical protein NHX12_023329 [Muraenolepis orangiensis]|uniref:Uncharacterized protein n=1 Tax=Muraenolepis orangiensis TaxID=630683 RepID=A0A9Q0IS15_9TELE|nr:hypothetical protein NHX12_023329 [Muraenolepis orangiensis]
MSRSARGMLGRNVPGLPNKKQGAVPSSCRPTLSVTGRLSCNRPPPPTGPPGPTRVALGPPPGLGPSGSPPHRPVLVD